MIQIDGLTDRQMAILDVIWNMDTQEQVNEWLESMDDTDRMECDVLAKMLVYAVVDSAIDSMSYYKEAEQVIRKLKYQSN